MTTKMRTVIQITMSVVVLVAGLGCDGDGPVQPGEVKYNIYVAALDWVDGVATDPLYIIDADSMEVIDSIPQIGSLWDMEVSPDGRWLYTYVHRGSIAGCSNDSLRRIDIKEKRIDWAVPSGLETYITLLDHGRVILRRWHQEAACPGGQDLIDAATGKRIRTLPDSLHHGEGPVEGTLVAAILREGVGAPIVATDVQTDSVYGHFVPRTVTGTVFIPRFARLHPDGETVLVIGGLATNVGWAVIGNLRTNDVFDSQRIFATFGEGVFSSDGTLAVTSVRSTGLTIFDIDSKRHLASLLAVGGQIRFIGDTKSVITCGVPDYFHASDPLWKFDLTHLRLETSVDLPLPEPLLGAMAVGRRP